MIVYARAAFFSVSVALGKEAQADMTNLRWCSFTVTISATVVCNTPMFLQDLVSIVFSLTPLLLINRMSLISAYSFPPYNPNTRPNTRNFAPELG
jgi:hypothetical protein